MSGDIVVRGDVERFCVGNDPTCTGVNPCRPCWEAIRNTVLPPSMRVANCTATDNQIQAFIRQHFTEWFKVLDSLRLERPDLFHRTVEARRPQLEREGRDAAAMGHPNQPLTPFAAVAMQGIPLGAGQAPPGVEQAPSHPSPPAAVDVGRAVYQQPQAQSASSFGASGMPPIGVPLGNVGRGSADAPPDWPGGDNEPPPLARGDVGRIVRNGTRRETGNGGKPPKVKRANAVPVPEVPATATPSTAPNSNGGGVQ